MRLGQLLLQRNELYLQTEGQNFGFLSSKSMLFREPEVLVSTGSAIQYHYFRSTNRNGDKSFLPHSYGIWF